MNQPRDPFRREADAFRVVVMIFAAAAIVIAVTLLTRPLIGAIVGLVLLCVGLSGERGASPASGGERPHRRSDYLPPPPPPVDWIR